MDTRPREGFKYVNATVNWATDAGPGLSVAFSLSNLTPVVFSRIAGVVVDNTQCGSDARISFADGGPGLLIPAYSSVTAPVYTNGNMLIITAPLAGGSDSTLLSILNYVPETVIINPEISNERVAFTNIITTVMSPSLATQGLIGAGISGTLLGFIVGGFGQAQGATVGILDGDNTYFLLTNFAVGRPQPLTMTDTRVRFFNGLNAQAGSNDGTQIQIQFSVYYRSP